MAFNLNGGASCHSSAATGPFSCAIFQAQRADSRHCPRGFVWPGGRGARPATPDSSIACSSSVRVPAKVRVRPSDPQHTSPPPGRDRCPTTAYSPLISRSRLAAAAVRKKLRHDRGRVRFSADHFQSNFGSSLAQGLQVENPDTESEASRILRELGPHRYMRGQNFFAPYLPERHRMRPVQIPLAVLAAQTRKYNFDASRSTKGGRRN